MLIPKRYQHLPKQFAHILTKMYLYLDDELPESEFDCEDFILSIAELRYLKELEIDVYQVNLEDNCYETLPFFFLAAERIEWWLESLEKGEDWCEKPVEEEDIWFYLLHLKDAYEARCEFLEKELDSTEI